MKPAFNSFKRIIPIVIILVSLISTTIEKKLFEPIHYEVLKELSLHIREWEDKYGEDHFLKIFNISSPEYLNFYGEQTGTPHQLDIDVINYGDAQLLESLLISSSKSHLMLGYSGRDTPIQFLNQCLKYYPFVVEIHQYTNSTIVLLSKHLKSNHEWLKPVKTISLNDPGYHWDFELSKFDSLQGYYYADSTNVYLPQLVIPMSEIIDKRHFIRVKLKAKIDALCDISIVAQPQHSDNELVKDNNGKPYYMGLDVEQDLERFGEASFAFSIPKNVPKNAKVKIYIWNRNKVPFLIEELNVEIIKNIWNN